MTQFESKRVDIEIVYYWLLCKQQFAYLLSINVPVIHIDMYLT